MLPGDREWIKKSWLLSIEDPSEQDGAQPEAVGFVEDAAMYLMGE